MLRVFFYAGMPPDPAIETEEPIRDQLHGQRHREKDDQLVQIIGRSPITQRCSLGQAVRGNDDRDIEQDEHHPGFHLGRQQAQANGSRLSLSGHPHALRRNKRLQPWPKRREPPTAFLISIPHGTPDPLFTPARMNGVLPSGQARQPPRCWTVS